MAGILEKVHNYIIWQRIKNQNKEKNRGKILASWVNAGKPIPPPHVVKQEVIREFRKNFSINILVETGTFRGEMVYAQRNTFNKIYSIELSEELHKIADIRLKQLSNINLLRGDSSEVLKHIISEIEEPAIFWLDGHYSGFETAKGDFVTPVKKELESILTDNKKHFILIDDARLFTGKDDYPTLQEIKDYLFSYSDQYEFDVEDDIIRIYPSENY
jgi:hypothetical protein